MKTLFRHCSEGVMSSVDIVAEKHCFYNGVVVLGKLEIYDKLEILRSRSNSR